MGHRLLLLSARRRRVTPRLVHARVATRSFIASQMMSAPFTSEFASSWVAVTKTYV